MSPALRHITNSIRVAMNPSANHHEPVEANCVPCAAETLREVIRHQHPEWVDPAGECPPCNEMDLGLTGLNYFHSADY
jgi:hypothetical protein